MRARGPLDPSASDGDYGQRPPGQPPGFGRVSGSSTVRVLDCIQLYSTGYTVVTAVHLCV